MGCLAGRPGRVGGVCVHMHANEKHLCARVTVALGAQCAAASPVNLCSFQRSPFPTQVLPNLVGCLATGCVKSLNSCSVINTGSCRIRCGWRDKFVLGKTDLIETGYKGSRDERGYSAEKQIPCWVSWVVSATQEYLDCVICGYI